MMKVNVGNIELTTEDTKDKLKMTTEEITILVAIMHLRLHNTCTLFANAESSKMTRKMLVTAQKHLRYAT